MRLLRRLAVPMIAGLLLVPAQVAEAAPRPTTTTVFGWTATPGHLAAGRTFRVAVRANGPKRVVALQRLTSGRWHRVALAIEDARGTAHLRWTPPAAMSRAVLRVHVRPDGKRAAADTGRRTLTVAPSPVPASSASATPSVSATPSTSPAPITDAQLDRVLVLVNQARAAGATCGGTVFPTASPLTRTAALDGVAQAYAERMATEDFFSHTAPDGSTPQSRAAAAGLPWPAENIAAGYRTADDVVGGWLRSEGHCRNLMDASYSRVGLGRATSAGSSYGTYWVQDFTG